MKSDLHLRAEGKVKSEGDERTKRTNAGDRPIGQVGNGLGGESFLFRCHLSWHCTDRQADR
jgi:hypothetical protein